jgi:hypothetical protein
MDQEGMLKPALIGGVLLGVLSAIPVISLFNCLCCAWVIAGGMLAAHLYIKGSPMAVTLGRGVALGLLTGAIGAVVDTLFSIPVHLALRSIGMGFAGQMRQVFDQVPNLPAETRDALNSIFAGGGGVSLVFIVLSGFFKLVVYGIMAMLGGTIGVALFEKRKPGATYGISGPIPPPPSDLPPPPSIPTS